MTHKKEKSMFANAKLQTVVCTTNLERARAFYCDLLGLKLTAEGEGALVFDINGSDLRVSPVATLTPSEHTQFGFSVEDLAYCVQELHRRELVCVRFPQMPHDADGIVTTPDGSRVAWFRDPDGSLFSVVQFKGGI